MRKNIKVYFYIALECSSSKLCLREQYPQLDSIVHYVPKLSQSGFEPYIKVSQTFNESAEKNPRRDFALCAFKGSNLGPSP